MPFSDLFDELLELVEEDLDALGGHAEVEGLRDLVTNGTSADRQRAVRTGSGAEGDAAGRAVVQHLIAEFTADL